MFKTIPTCSCSSSSKTGAICNYACTYLHSTHVIVVVVVEEQGPHVPTQKRSVYKVLYTDMLFIMLDILLAFLWIVRGQGHVTIPPGHVML